MLFWWVLRASCGEKVANMGPTWFPRWSQNQWKMRSKINQIFNAFWNRFFMRFWWIFGGKMEASWHQHGSKIDVQFEKRCFDTFERSGGQSWDEKSIKKRSTNELNIRRSLGIDFKRILVDFWTQLGRQNPSKVDVKMHEKK